MPLRSADFRRILRPNTYKKSRHSVARCQSWLRCINICTHICTYVHMNTYQFFVWPHNSLMTQTCTFQASTGVLGFPAGEHVTANLWWDQSTVRLRFSILLMLFGCSLLLVYYHSKVSRTSLHSLISCFKHTVKRTVLQITPLKVKSWQ